MARGRRRRRFFGHPVEEIGAVALPGRLERRPGEIRDGAHNPDGLAWADRAVCPPPSYTVCASILADKDVDEMLRRLALLGRRFVATRSSNSRALDALELAKSARRHFEVVEAVADPTRAVRRAHELGEPVLVTGSLYLSAY